MTFERGDRVRALCDEECQHEDCSKPGEHFECRKGDILIVERQQESGCYWVHKQKLGPDYGFEMDADNLALIEGEVITGEFSNLREAA